jgi:uncharacterized protein Yka (UPF0111/DUF47 family)
LAVDKPVFLELVSRQDRIADYAENVVEILSFRDLYDNSEARKLVLNLADAVTSLRASELSYKSRKDKISTTFSA